MLLLATPSLRGFPGPPLSYKKNLIGVILFFSPPRYPTNGPGIPIPGPSGCQGIPGDEHVARRGAAASRCYQDGAEKWVILQTPTQNRKDGGEAAAAGRSAPQTPLGSRGVGGGLLLVLLPTTRLCSITTVQRMLKEGGEDGDLPPGDAPHTSCIPPLRYHRSQHPLATSPGSGWAPMGKWGCQIPSVLGGRQLSPSSCCFPSPCTFNINIYFYFFLLFYFFFARWHSPFRSR